MIDLNLSYPAVSKIYIFISLFSRFIVLTAKSIPTVGMKLSENLPSENRRSRLVLPTDELPTTSNLII